WCGWRMAPHLLHPPQYCYGGRAGPLLHRARRREALWRRGMEERESFLRVVVPRAALCDSLALRYYLSPIGEEFDTSPRPAPRSRRRGKVEEAGEARHNGDTNYRRFSPPEIRSSCRLRVDGQR